MFLWIRPSVSVGLRVCLVFLYVDLGLCFHSFLFFLLDHWPLLLYPCWVDVAVVWAGAFFAWS